MSGLLSTAITANRICVVAATAGAGKTTAVVEACGRLEHHLAWLTVDIPDAAPGRLLSYLEAAIATCSPAAEGVVASAIMSGAPHVETAGLLADAIGEEPTVIVLDELERLGASAEAWSVIEALIRYAPTGTCLVLISRDDPPANILALSPPHTRAVITDDHLAFTIPEAADALVQSGRRDTDAHSAVASAAGWVAGVLFQGHAQVGGGYDPHHLHDYLAAHVVGRLPHELADFLITTSLLHEITPQRAIVFGYPDAAVRLAALRPLHLPATWSDDGSAMTCHSALREYLLTRLNERSEGEVRAARLAHGRLLTFEGHHEEAVEEFLAAQAHDECAEAAAKAVTAVVMRMDFDVAERWLSALSDHHSPGLTVARLLIAFARDDIARALTIADRSRQASGSPPPSRKGEQLAYLMAWCYLHHARWDDIEEVLRGRSPGPGVTAIRHAVSVLHGPVDAEQTIRTPSPTWGVDEVMINIGKYLRGQLTALTERSEFGWDSALRRPWIIAALRALGRTEEAMRNYRAFEPTRICRTALLTFAGPDLLIDAGAREEAWRVIQEGKALAAASGSLMFQGAAGLAEAKFLLRIRDDPAAAHTVLDSPELAQATDGFRYVREVAGVWRGLAFLKQERYEHALECLRTAVASIVDGDRILELPAAAVYLAEAEWQMGNEDEADLAADLALNAARRQGSNHQLLQALDDAPAVLSRRLDAERSSGSAWHDLGRTRIVGVQGNQGQGQASVILREFGRRELTVAGDEVKLPIAKSYELLAYMTTRPGETVSRESLLGVLFDHRTDASSRSYLRQAIRWLKEALPESILAVDPDTVTLSDPGAVASEAMGIERGLTEAARLLGDARLEATLRSIAPLERGVFLPGVRSAWADERERALVELVTEARSQAASIAVDLGRVSLAIDLARRVLEEDPARESAWQTLMRASEAGGDQDGIVRAFRECEVVLSRLGTQPSPTTRSLLEHLRR